jgi:site-specific recombinase XerD
MSALPSVALSPLVVEVVSVGPPLAQHAEAFLRWFRFIRRRSENTCVNYGRDLSSFLTFAAQAGLERPDEVRYQHIEAYLGHLQLNRGVSPRTANRHLHALRSWWKWMTRERLAPDNPPAEVFLLPTQKTLPRRLSIAQQEQLLAALARDCTLLGWRDYALVALALLTGLRCAELSHLQLGHLDLDAGILRVVDGKGRKDRELPIIPRLERILRPYLEVTRPALLALSAGYIAPPRPQKGERSWAIVRTLPNGKRVRVARAGSREEAEGLRAASPAGLSANPYVFVRGRAQWLPTHGAQPLGPRTIFMTIRRLCERVLHQKVHPHMLRHSFASRLRENGADLQDIQEALGHASITTTTMYAHLTTRRQREKLAKYLR